MRIIWFMGFCIFRFCNQVCFYFNINQTFRRNKWTCNYISKKVYIIGSNKSRYSLLVSHQLTLYTLHTINYDEDFYCKSWYFVVGSNIGQRLLLQIIVMKTYQVEHTSKYKPTTWTSNKCWINNMTLDLPLTLKLGN